MAIAAASVLEVQTGGNDTNGGGFVTGAAGTDYSLVAGKRTAGDVTDISTTDAVAAGTTTITSLTANFQTTIVGNIVYFQGGTGSIAATWRQVTARASTTSITIDASIATSTGMTMNIGGALLSPGIAHAVAAVSKNTVWIKSGTYSITSTTSNAAGGRVTQATTTIITRGYETTRGDFGARPLLQASGISSTTLFTMAATGGLFNINVDGAGLTSIKGILGTTRDVIGYCGALNCTNTGFEIASGIAYSCYATGCSTATSAINANGVCTLLGCMAYDNTTTGFRLANGVAAQNCIADSNTGASSDGFLAAANGVQSIINCTSYGNGRDGFRGESTGFAAFNCIAESNAGVGFNEAGSGDWHMLDHCSVFGDTVSGTFELNLALVTGTATFFNNAAGGDFTLNNTAGDGATQRATALPTVLPTV